MNEQGGTLTALASSELYDPATGKFSVSGSMTTARADHSATLLPDGNVLMAGGIQTFGQADPTELSSAELYDPLTGSYRSTGSMTTGRAGHTATPLATGGVLIAGDGPGPGFSVLDSAEIYR